VAVASKCVWLYCSLTYRPGIRPPSQALVVAPQKLKTVAGFRVELLDASDQNTEFNSDIQTIRLNVSVSEDWTGSINHGCVVAGVRPDSVVWPPRHLRRQLSVCCNLLL